MADLRIPSSSSLTPVQPAARSEAVKAAQRAFFNAALTEAQATTPVRPQRTETFAPTTAPQRASAKTDAGPPDRILRPGSLLDIRV